MNQYISDKKSIVICGDIHGEFIHLVYCLKINNISDTLIIVAGDCGFGFQPLCYYEDLYKELSPELSEQGNEIVFVRGNHDDPAYFTNNYFFKEFMKCVPDYTIITGNRHNILCVGGAVSIDRQMRLEDMKQEKTKGKNRTLYWEDEPPLYIPEAIERLSEQNILVDTVVTHSAPDFCANVEKANLKIWTEKDETLAHDVSLERLRMTSIFDELIEDNHPLTHWFYGHFHASWYAHIEGVNFTMLNIMEMKTLL